MLVVHSDVSFRRAVVRILLDANLEVFAAEDLQAAHGLAQSHPVDLLIATVDPPVFETLRAVEKLRGSPDLLALLQGSEITDKTLLQHRAVAALLALPLSDLSLLQHSCLRALELRRLRQRSEQDDDQDGPDGFGTLVGAGLAMQRAFAVASSIAGTHAPVLIVGERGTGKTRLARMIHERSPRSARPLLDVDCLSVPKQLHASVIAGEHTTTSIDGGTLLLRHVDALDHAAHQQVIELLRRATLDSLDVRVIATTRCDPAELRRSERIPDELLTQLSIGRIDLPPLRQRKEDVAVLAYRALQAANHRTGCDVSRIGAEALRSIRAHDWPGNIRELESVVERAVVHAKKETLVPGDIDLSQATEFDLPTISETLTMGPSVLDLPYNTAKERVVDAFHQAYAARLLKATANNISEAARQAGLDRSNFRRLFKAMLPKKGSDS